MKFVKEYVLDNRFQTGKRPVMAESNFINIAFIKLFLLLENIFKSGRIFLESLCKEIEESQNEGS